MINDLNYKLVIISFTILIGLMLSCGSEESSPDNSTENLPISEGPEIPSEDTCNQEYSVCGYISIPADLQGMTTSIAVALYSEIPPTASPEVLITQIENPSVTPGERYPIRAYPFLDTGEYYLWINLYMEGGGIARPINGVDYTGYLSEKSTFDGQPFDFGTITLDFASGF